MDDVTWLRSTLALQLPSRLTTFRESCALDEGCDVGIVPIFSTGGPQDTASAHACPTFGTYHSTYGTRATAFPDENMQSILCATSRSRNKVVISDSSICNVQSSARFLILWLGSSRPAFVALVVDLSTRCRGLAGQTGSLDSASPAARNPILVQRRSGVSPAHA